jgi:diguanylate cyclase (GGDEF)-like protein
VAGEIDRVGERTTAAVAAVCGLLLGLGLMRLFAYGFDDSSATTEVRHLIVYGLATGLVLGRIAAIKIEREVWIAFAIGVVFNMLGAALQPHSYGSASLPAADLAQLLGMISNLVGLALFLRRRLDDAVPIFWLDAIGRTAMLSAISVAACLAALQSRSGIGDVAGTLTLIFPAANAAIALVVVTVIAATRRKLGRQDVLLAGGFGVAFVAATISALGLADVVPDLGRLVALLFEVSVLMVGAAAWARPTPSGSIELGGWWEYQPALWWMVGSVSVLVVAAFTAVPGPAVLLAVIAIACAAVRMFRVTEEIQRLSAHRREALTDDLTELPNRGALFRELELIVREDRRVEGATLLIADLDGFKELSDTLGHEAADAMTVAIGERLKPVVPGMLAHLGGDLFAIVLCDPDDPSTVTGDVMKALARPVDVEGIAVSVTARIGTARFPDDAGTATELARRAGVALNEAHRSGMRVAAYSEEHDDHSRERLALATDLRQALEDPDGAGLWVAFQPQVEFANGRVAGAEALIRWNHPVRGEVSPAELLPVAEQTGLMPRLTDWVMDTAIASAAIWHRKGGSITVSVNVSAGTLVDTRLPERILTTLRRHRLPAEKLVIEVTEDAVMVDPRRCREVLVQIQRLGVEISVDDFGTGHSSLAQLKTIPSAELKIDKSFVLGIQTDRLDREIVQVAADMGRRLGLRIVAEGVENHATFAMLAAMGCTLAQGFGIGRPMTQAQFERYLEAPPEIARRIVPHLHAA